VFTNQVSGQVCSIVFGEPIGSGPRKDRRRLVAFCLVIAGAALIPTQHVERREPDASAPPTITTSPWVSGWSMRRRALGGGRRLLAVDPEGTSMGGG
jgi:hypothetical protein